MLATLLALLFFAAIALVVLFAPGRATTGGRPPAQPSHGASPVSVRTAAPRNYYRSHSSAYWAWRYRQRTRQLQAVRAVLHRRWAPTVTYALRLAAAVTGVPYTDLAAVAWCESRHQPWAQNGRYKGIFQLGWAPFGMSPFDPVASALSTALTVVREGWRQWECQP